MDEAATIAKGIPNPRRKRAITNMATAGIIHETQLRNRRRKNNAQSCAAICRMAPMIIIILPTMIDIRRPNLSATSGTNGRDAMEPREYKEDMRPRMVEFGLLKSGVVR